MRVYGKLLEIVNLQFKLYNEMLQWIQDPEVYFPRCMKIQCILLEVTFEGHAKQNPTKMFLKGNLPARGDAVVRSYSS